MVSSDNYTTGLFPFLYAATIKDLTLNDVTITNGYTWNGAFSPLSYGNDTIINCHLEGDCIIAAGTDFSNNWNYTAGIVGINYAESLTIKDCTVGEDVVINGRGDSGRYRVAGGMLACTRHSTTTLIQNCVNRADISSDYIAAGIMGSFMQTNQSSVNNLSYGAIVDCYNYGNISSNPNTTNTVNVYAGILAESTSFASVVVNRCGNYGDVTVGTSSAQGSGGVAAEVDSAAIVNCFNAGNITAVSSNCLGGVVGHTRTDTYGSPITGSVDIGQFYLPLQYNTITNCYNVGTVYNESGTGETGGIVGICQENETQAGNSEVYNVYNFGSVSAGEARYGAVVAETDIKFENAFAAEGTKAISHLQDSSGHASPYTCTAGYYDSASKGGTVYPATVVSGPVINANSDVGDATETISSTPLATDLKETLDAFVDEVNPDFAVSSGQTFTLLPWTYSDGTDGLGIHPIFGYDIKNLDPESDKETNGGYLSLSKDGVAYEDIGDSSKNVITVTAVPNSGSTLKSLTVTDQNGDPVTVTNAGGDVYTFDMPALDVTVDAEWETTSREPNNTVYLTTKDSVDINFVLDIDYYTQDPDAYVKLTYNHNPRTYETDFYEETRMVSDVEKTADGRYIFTILSAPAQLTESIDIEICDSTDAVVYSVDYSMWMYCNDIINRAISMHEAGADEETTNYWDGASELCKSLVDYATAAQVYFEYNTVDMASKEVHLEDPYYTDDITNEIYYHDVPSVSTNDIKTNTSPVASISGSFPIAHTSLMSLSNTEVRFYYEGDINRDDYELSVTCDNWYGSARPTAHFARANSGNFITVGGIEAVNLDNPFTLTIVNKNTNETTTVTYTALAYCYTVLRDTASSSDRKEQELRTLVKSVYLYNRYAQDYFDEVSA